MSQSNTYKGLAGIAGAIFIILLLFFFFGGKGNDKVAETHTQSPKSTTGNQYFYSSQMESNSKPSESSPSKSDQGKSTELINQGEVATLSASDALTEPIEEEKPQTSQELMSELNQKNVEERKSIQKDMNKSLTAFVEEDNKTLNAYQYSGGEEKSLSFFDKLFGKNEKMNIGTTDRDLLARIIEAEAGDQPYAGKVAVAAVVLNRVKSGSFPNNVKDVIYARGQFEPISNGRFFRVTVTDQDYKAADEAINGSDPSNGALYFYAPSLVYSAFHESLHQTAVIGGHVFSKP